MHSSSGGMFSEGETVCRRCHTTDGPWEPDSVTAEGPLCTGCAAEEREGSIKTTFVYPPIPIRDFDWMATFGDYDLGCRVGYGKTPEEAIEDLKEQL